MHWFNLKYGTQSPSQVKQKVKEKLIDLSLAPHFCVNKCTDFSKEANISMIFWGHRVPQYKNKKSKNSS